MYEPVMLLEKRWLARWAACGKYKYAIADYEMFYARFTRSARANRAIMLSISHFRSGEWGYGRCVSHGRGRTAVSDHSPPLALTTLSHR